MRRCVAASSGIASSSCWRSLKAAARSPFAATMTAWNGATSSSPNCAWANPSSCSLSRTASSVWTSAWFARVSRSGVFMAAMSSTGAPAAAPAAPVPACRFRPKRNHQPSDEMTATNSSTTRSVPSGSPPDAGVPEPLVVPVGAEVLVPPLAAPVIASRMPAAVATIAPPFSLARRPGSRSAPRIVSRRALVSGIASDFQ